MSGWGGRCGIRGSDVPRKLICNHNDSFVLRVRFSRLNQPPRYSINMKCLIPLSLLVASVVAAPTAAPAPAQAEGVSFPITDLIDSDLTFDEYAAQLEGQEAGEAALAKRQYNGDTFNQFTDGSA
jgi:hypothetical protein